MFGLDAITKTCVGISADNGGINTADPDTMFRADLNSDGVIDARDAMLTELVMSGHKTR